MDLWGLAPENEYALLGTKVHSIFAMHIRSKSPFGSWGGQDARLIAGLGSTWPTGLGGLLPDAYHVTPLNLLNEKAKKSFVGSVWELSLLVICMTRKNINLQKINYKVILIMPNEVLGVQAAIQ